MYENFEQDFKQAVTKWNKDNEECQIKNEPEDEYELKNLYDLERISELCKKIKEHNKDKEHEDLFKILKQIEKVENLKKQLKAWKEKYISKKIDKKQFYQEHFTLMAKLYLLPQYCSSITHEYTNCVSDGFEASDIDNLINWLEKKNTMPITREKPSPELLSFIKLLRPDCKLQADKDQDNIKVYSEYKNAIFEQWPKIAKEYKNLDNKYYFETLCALLWQIMLFLITKKDFTKHKEEFEERLESMTNKNANLESYNKKITTFVQEQFSKDDQGLQYLMRE